MIRLKIDGLEVETSERCSVLEAARDVGAEIPALCDLPGYPAHTSCMICLVKDSAAGTMLPACSVRVREGMEIDTCCDEVIESRRGALELLLSEHVGDCEGPCRLGCPARMDIPRMIRQIAAGDLKGAVLTVKRHIALPAVLGRICPAPCEKVCRRREVDEAVSICLLKRFVADLDLAEPPRAHPVRSIASGRRVAVVGAGPAGLAAAYYLRLQGHDCTVFDERDLPGGMLRYGVDPARLPREVLDAEIAGIGELGVLYRMKHRIGDAAQFRRLRRKFDAVILAVGETGPDFAGRLGLSASERGIRAEKTAFTTGVEGVFAGGAAVTPTRLAVRAAADGRLVAEAAGRYLAGGDAAAGGQVRFNSRIGRLDPDELREYASDAGQGGRVAAVEDGDGGYSAAEARREAARCLHCDCRARGDCLLRSCAEKYDARQVRAENCARPPFKRFGRGHGVVFEPGKCIRCGRCVRITEKAGEPLGLTFIGRGFDIRVGTPFDAPLEEALHATAAQCVDACPTGALAWYEEAG